MLFWLLNLDFAGGGDVQADKQRLDRRAQSFKSLRSPNLRAPR